MFVTVFHTFVNTSLDTHLILVYFILTWCITFLFFTIYYISLLPFTTIYFSFITSFITICNLGIFVTIYSIITNGVFICYHLFHLLVGQLVAWVVEIHCACIVASAGSIGLSFSSLVRLLVLWWCCGLCMAVVCRWQICAHTNLELFSHWQEFQE